MPIPLKGDRGVFDVANYATLHASDLEAAAPTVHVPLPGVAGTVPVSDGSKWVAGPVTPTVTAGNVGYTPAVATDWNGDADPGDVDDALDQLAARTDDLEGAGHAAVTLDVNADTLLSLSTQALGLDTQTANRVLAGPDTGAAAVPTFRALVTADLPSHSHAVDAAAVTYTPSVATDWDSDADPGDVDDALNQLAERTDDLEATAHAAVTLGAGNDAALALSGQQLTLTLPAGHAAVTLGNDADVLLGLTGQELTFDTQTANRVLAGPETGAAADPTFRALVAADLPSHSHSVDAAAVTYTPTVATDWNGNTDPGDVDDALNQLAERVDDLEGTSGHAAVTLASDADTLLGLSGQQLTLDTQVANRVLAGPATGADADPTFRALVAADIPTIAASAVSVVTTGFSGNLDSGDNTVQAALATLDALAAGGITVTDILYADLVTAIGGDDLVPLAWYRITDFNTTHFIVGSDVNAQYITGDGIITGANEPLLVQAMTTSELGSQAISESYPKDILRYDWNPDNWMTDPSIWEQGGPTLITGFKGVLTYRHDTVSDNLAYYDWRNAKTRRWAIAVDAWAAGSYVAGSYVLHNDYLYYASVTTSGVPGTSHDWVTLVRTAGGGANWLGLFWCPSESGWNAIPADANNYVDVLTFQGDFTNTLANHLGRGPSICGQLSTFANNCKNNTVEYPSSHTFDYSCAGNQMSKYSELNWFGASVLYNDIGMYCSVNLFGENSGTIKLTINSFYNIFGGCSDIMAVGSAVNSNVFGDGCTNFLLGSGESSHVFPYQTTNRNYLSSGNTYVELDSTGASAGYLLTATGSGGHSAFAAPAGLVPIGGIIMWSGTVATIPANWALCNGSNSTPDLRDRFIVGAKQDDSGVAKTNLTGSLTQSGGAVDHHHANHTFTQPTAHGTLTHTTGNDSSTTGGTAKVVATTHTLTNNHSGGAVDAHDTLSAPQPYYALAFIMRTA
jgi:hypothetical protein